MDTVKDTANHQRCLALIREIAEEIMGSDAFAQDHPHFPPTSEGVMKALETLMDYLVA